MPCHRIIVHELYADKQEIGGGHRDEEGAADRADGGDDVHDDDEIDGDDVNRKHLGALFFQARAAEAHRPAHGHIVRRHRGHPHRSEGEFQRLTDHDEGHRKEERQKQIEEGKEIEKQKPTKRNGRDVAQEDDGHIDDAVNARLAEIFDIRRRKGRFGIGRHAVVQNAADGKIAEGIQKPAEQIDDGDADQRPDDLGHLGAYQRHKRRHGIPEMFLKSLQKSAVAADKRRQEPLYIPHERGHLRTFENIDQSGQQQSGDQSRRHDADDEFI